MSVFGLYFATPWAFLGLLVLPILVWRMVDRARHGRTPTPTQAAFEGLPRGVFARIWWVPDVLRLLAVAVLIVAVARPQTEDRRTVSGEGVDIMLALDMSGSMNAVDMAEPDLDRVLAAGETPRNRFQVARDILKAFISSRTQDRIGLVIFGPEAWLKYPLTLDYARLTTTLDDLVLAGLYGDPRTGQCFNGCTISGAGTAIGDALGRGYNRLRRSRSKSRVLVLITDGKQEGGSLDPLALARHLASLPSDRQVAIYTFLVGSQEQTWIPAADRRGRPMRDVEGRPVYTRPNRPFPVDPELLRAIAEMTGGKFYESYSEDKFRADIQDLERTVFQSRVQVTRSDVFLPLALLALWLLALEWLCRFTRWRGIV